MKKIGVLGATGYVGEELIRLLYNHPKVKLSWLGSKQYVGKSFSEIYPQYTHVVDKVLEEEPQALHTLDLDILFIALPHGLTSQKVTHKLLERTKVIDLGADFRLAEATYEKWYEVKHEGKALLEEAVYGLSEWQRESIKQARLVANPGCYVTCALLSLLPLIKEGLVDEKTLIIDGKSGVSGAGRGLGLATLYTECNESIKAYNVGKHRHQPEIEEKLHLIGGKDARISFVPHLVPMNRGILTTSYASIKEGVKKEDIAHAFQKYYSHERFIRLLKEDIVAQTRWVKGSNYCDISYTIDEANRRVIIVSAIDNMMKGAASQAVQNMNLMMGWEEHLGIDFLPTFPI